MKIDDFQLEKYLEKYEFCAPYLLCTSDCQSMSAKELLEFCKEPFESYLDVWLGYTETKGSPSLRRAISSVYTSITPDEIITFSGAEEGIFVFMNAALSPGDNIIVMHPGYQSLYEIAKSIGCSVTFWEMREEDDWKPDLSVLRSLIRENTAAVILNTPHNPTGYNFSKDDLEDIVKIASEHSLYLFSDEVYRGIEYSISDRLPAVADSYSKGVSLGVMSKAYGLAGLRVGWIASKDSELMEGIAGFKNYTSICQSAPSEFLSEIAVKNSEKLIERNLEIIRGNLKLLDGFFLKYRDILGWVRPKASSIGFVRIKTGENADSFCMDVMKKAGVLLLPSTVYGFSNTHFRIGFGRADMKDALVKFEEYLDEKYHIKQ
ncbi:aspartate/methionine/tyrosine aminotransferase [Methanomicrobium sp. W14]|uniref:aminotransferase class I/II-fold pyridoxal phosphate-dependent enzyme n=1 Tax=Methanomicrobium sp. W14 TaxID=2817839 RepID=UPI001AE608AE|nr:aminotransferase class I/II-fold pyridoxal phosphate-dependent enzyme [Methanomicrobium sp. W14]MBP2133750.1 aspartate/methionine/tyrosine aminotransferase [Methanomicrobium sp. W14]